MGVERCICVGEGHVAASRAGGCAERCFPQLCLLQANAWMAAAGAGTPTHTHPTPQDVLATVREHNPAGRLEDLSVHLCFICVLHLANEHGLVVRDAPQLDRLIISNVPAA